MQKYIKIIIAICIIAINGCSSKLMSPAMTDVDNDKLDENTSCVTFFRHYIAGNAVQAPIAEYIDGDLKFIGISSYNTRFRLLTTPGSHIFVVGGESGNILKADLKGKKNYYVHVSPNLGLFKARFDLKAVHQDEIEKNKDNIVKCNLVVPNSKSEKWFDDNKISMRKKAKTGLEKFERRDDKSPYILNPEDGVDMLY